VDDDSQDRILKNPGCMVPLLVVLIAASTREVMSAAFDAGQPWAGATAVAALALLGVGLARFLFRSR
jgi:hypothetical protein